MSFFKKVFKAVKNVGTGILKVAKPLSGLVAGLNIPLLSSGASLVNKLIPDVSPKVQEQALQFIESAANSEPLTALQSIVKAGEMKQALIGIGVPAEQASSLGAVVKVVAEAAPGAAPAVLAHADNTLPANSLAAGFTKDDIKTILNGALEGAKGGAVDAYLDKTESGKETKAEAVESQGQKILPFVMLGGMVLLWFAKKNQK